MNKFLLSVALLTAATLTVDAAGKPGNGGNNNGNGGNNGGNNGKPIQNGNGNTGVVGPKPITLPKDGNANNGNKDNGNKDKVVNKNNQDGKNDKDKNDKVVQKGDKGDKNDKDFDKNKKDFKNVQVLDPKVKDKDYHLHNAKKFNFGFCYQGNFHQHWSHCCYFNSYGCNCNWCPASLCWYYWCAWDNCWYPVTYCPYGRYVF